MLAVLQCRSVQPKQGAVVLYGAQTNLPQLQYAIPFLFMIYKPTKAGLDYIFRWARTLISVSKIYIMCLFQGEDPKECQVNLHGRAMCSHNAHSMQQC